MKTLMISVSLVTLVMAAACGHAAMNRPHDDADLSTRRVSRSGTYQVSYQPAVSPVPRRQLHAWTVEVRTRDGHPVDGARIEVAGGMPDHGHGLPTHPALREALGGGRYVVDGMKFNMGGYWVVDLSIDAAAGRDDVRFELKL